MIREQIANEFKWSNLFSLSWDDALTLTDKLFSLLRAEIEKVGLSDEEICLAMLEGMGQVDTNVEEMIKDGFLSEHHRRIAQAQLQKILNELKEGAE